MPTLIDLIEMMGRGRRAGDHRPWPRATVSADEWQFAVMPLAARRWLLLGLWGDRDAVHMALAEEASGAIGIISLDCADRQFPSVAQLHPPALHLEAAIRDLFGLQPTVSPDLRQWLDHGEWGVRYPLGLNEPPRETPPYPLLPAAGGSPHPRALR